MTSTIERQDSGCLGTTRMVTPWRQRRVSPNMSCTLLMFFYKNCFIVNFWWKPVQGCWKPVSKQAQSALTHPVWHIQVRFLVRSSATGSLWRCAERLQVEDSDCRSSSFDRDANRLDPSVPTCSSHEEGHWWLDWARAYSKTWPGNLFFETESSFCICLHAWGSAFNTRPSQGSECACTDIDCNCHKLRQTLFYCTLGGTLCFLEVHIQRGAHNQLRLYNGDWILSLLARPNIRTGKLLAGGFCPVREILSYWFESRELGGWCIEVHKGSS